MARTAASHLSMRLGERRGEGAAEPEGLLILAHLSLFLIQLIKVLIRLTLTPPGNDELAAEEELGTLYTVSAAVDGGGRRSRRQEGREVVRGAYREVEDKAKFICEASFNNKATQSVVLETKGIKTK